MALVDVVGVASIMPFMAVLANPGVVETNSYLAAVYHSLGFTDRQAFLFFLGVVVFAALVLSIAVKALTTYAQLRFIRAREYAISRRLVVGFLNQPYEWFLNRHSAMLGTTVLSEVGQVVNGVMTPMMQLIAHSAVVIALLSLLVVVSPLLALAVGGVLGVAYGLIYGLLRGYLARIGADRVWANKERYRAVSEAFGGIKDVKVTGLETAFVHRFDGPAKRFARHQATAQVAAQLPRFALEAVAFGGMLLVALSLMRGPGGLQTALPIVAVYAFAGYRLLPALQSVYAALSNLRFGGAALDSLHRDLTELSPHAEEDAAAEPLLLERDVTLERVSYTYPQAGREALEGVSLRIPARATIGLVGATGGGKTTTVDIIMGLLRPQQGALKVDGALITPENLRAWQRVIGYVPQHIYLADDTVAANIAFGLPRERIEARAVERAARIANLHSFVTKELPHGYETAVGERGVRLSGGQRQRIGIARALYHGPQVLILDEATSALDNLTEQAVMEAVHNLSHELTIILIAHRLSTVRTCDQIYLLEQGRVTDQGTYAELLAQSPRFRAMAVAARESADERMKVHGNLTADPQSKA